MLPANINYNAVNVHINGFGHEDLSRVTADVLTRCLKQLPNGNKGLLDLVKLIHHDTDGNMNIRCLAGDVDDGTVMSYYDGDKRGWMIDSKKKVMDGLIKRPISLLEDHFHSNLKEFEEDLTSALFDFVKHWFADTRNKKNHIYTDSARRSYEMVKRWGVTIVNDIRQVREEKDEGDVKEQQKVQEGEEEEEEL
jgi:hypothetical protein